MTDNDHDPITDELRAMIRREVKLMLEKEALTMADTTRYAHVAFRVGGEKEIWRGVIYPDDLKDGAYPWEQNT